MTIQHGSTVRLSAGYLSVDPNNPDAGKTWTAQVCNCALCLTGDYLALNEPATEADKILWTQVFGLPAEDHPGWRHAHVQNVEEVTWIRFEHGRVAPGTMMESPRGQKCLAEHVKAGEEAWDPNADIPGSYLHYGKRLS
jgi:hypothetical protein